MHKTFYLSVKEVEKQLTDHIKLYIYTRQAYTCKHRPQNDQKIRGSKATRLVSWYVHYLDWSNMYPS